MRTFSKQLISFAFLASITPFLAHADQLDNIQKTGKITVAVFDSNPPFGYVDAQSKNLAGYDIDFANAIAKKLGVTVELKATNPANRIPLLNANKVDAVIAAFTISDERAKQVDFSVPYFVTGQQFLVKKGKFTRVDELKSAKIGAVKGTTEEQNVHAKFPQAKVLSFDEIAVAFAAQRNGNVQAITQDGAILAGLIAAAPEKDKASYVILPQAITTENYGIAVRKGESALLNKINGVLVELEKDGEAAAIYNTWFGPKSKTPLARTFKIKA